MSLPLNAEHLTAARYAINRHGSIPNECRATLSALITEKLGYDAPGEGAVGEASVMQDRPLPQVLDIDDDGDVDDDDLAMLFPEGTYGKRLKWIKWARDAKTQKTRGKYRGNGGLPKGLIVHFTAGHPDESFQNRAGQAARSSYAYLFITDDGSLGQANPLDRRGWHAGSEGIHGMTPAHDYLAGVEISCPGKMKSLGNGRVKNWIPGRTFDEQKCREVEAKDNVKAGLYYEYTEEQEETLIQLCLWLKWNDPKGFSFDHVVGHDEVAPRRKNDPGGSLSMTMPAFRKYLKDLWEKLPNKPRN